MYSILQLFEIIYFRDNFRQKTMFHFILRIVTWLVWYIKNKTNRGVSKHKIKIYLQMKNDKPEVAMANYRISVQGNGVTATFTPITLKQNHSNGICNFETESDCVLPSNISTLKFKGLDDGNIDLWFIKWIEIDEDHSRFTFNKWINPKSTFIRRSDTLLPQDESSQYCLDIRGKHLAEKRVKYGFELYRDKQGVPVKVSEVLNFCSGNVINFTRL